MFRLKIYMARTRGYFILLSLSGIKNTYASLTALTLLFLFVIIEYENEF